MKINKNFNIYTVLSLFYLCFIRLLSLFYTSNFRIIHKSGEPDVMLAGRLTVKRNHSDFKSLYSVLPHNSIMGINFFA